MLSGQGWVKRSPTRVPGVTVTMAGTHGIAQGCWVVLIALPGSHGFLNLRGQRGRRDKGEGRSREGKMELRF
jgi:hypothetical protein